jgi:hypothetical protein
MRYQSFDYPVYSCPADIMLNGKIAYPHSCFVFSGYAAVSLTLGNSILMQIANPSTQPCLPTNLIKRKPFFFRQVDGLFD